MESDRLPQVELTIPLREILDVGPFLLPAMAAPLMLQFRVAEPLASFANDAMSVTFDPPKVVVCAVLSPFGKVIEIALIVNASEAVLVPFVTEADVIVAVQSALSVASVGGA